MFPFRLFISLLPRCENFVTKENIAKMFPISFISVAKMLKICHKAKNLPPLVLDLQ
jgi:hypothetical protein